MTRKETQEKISQLGSWFHNLSLNGVQTAPSHFLGDYPAVKWSSFKDALPTDLHGMSVLDIGCNAGFYSLQLKQRGAERVVAIDHDETYLAQARFAAGVMGLDISFRNLSVYEIAELKEQFDLVLFMGVFYHLRHPLLALDLIREHVTKDWFIFQSMLRGNTSELTVSEDYDFEEQSIFDQPGFPKVHFIERRYSKDPTNWFIPNRAGAAAMLRSAAFRILNQPEREVFVCRVDETAERYPLPSVFNNLAR